jgi:glycosyltransferase involved in cell wall biosynthesis
MRILYVVHNVPPYEYTGAPLVVMQYATQAQRIGAAVGAVFAASEESGSKPFVRADGLHLFPVSSPPDQLWAPGWTLDEYAAPLVETSDVAALKAFAPDVVHIITWVNLPAAVLAAIRALGVPVIRTVCNGEDFCGFIVPIRFHPSGTACQAPLTAEQCAQCLTRGLPRPESNTPPDMDALEREYLAKVTAKWGALRLHLHEVYSELVFLCRAYQQYFESVVDVGDIARSTVDHGTTRPILIPSTTAKNPGDPIRFVFLGPCIHEKGWDAVEGCFARLLPEAAGRLTLTVFGSTSASRTRLAGLPGIELRDRYAYDDLDEILHDCDVGLVPTKFDTFNRVCREMLIRGVPVIASDAVGMRDAVVHRRNGLQIGQPTAHSLYDAVRLVLDEDGLLDTLRAGARATDITSAEDEFAQLLALYRRHMARTAIPIA